MAILFTISRLDRDFSCTADGGARFFVGRRVTYEGRIGLYNVFAGSKLEKLRYKAADFETEYGFWASVIEPTATVEGGGLFLTLNTYDSARFTFGFGQFAAHVANGDFVKYLRAMLTLPDAPAYFPHLGVVGGRICKTDGATPQPLEDDESTSKLMRYLNPSSDEVEDSEVIAAAKLIHWTSNSAAARATQVKQMADTFREHVMRADRRVGLDGVSADCCCVIADILHHGRNGADRWPRIETALRTSLPLAELLKIGLPRWKERLDGLKSAIAARPQLASRTWSRAAGDFR
jgi:hypothetical protein